jgi:hypothetical protein
MQSFAARMKIRAGKVVDSSAAMVRKVALVVDQTVVMATPVDTGRARANWIVGLNEVPTQNRPEEEVGEQIALSQARQAIASFKRNDQYIAIVNNLDYIKPLEDGSSAQAPQGMIKQALAAGAAARSAGKLL